MMDTRMSLIYEIDGRPVREDLTFAEFMQPDSSGRPRLFSLLADLDSRQQTFFLTPTREVYPADYSTGEIPAVSL